MKIKIFATLSLFILSCSPAETSKSKMVGGFPVDSANFHSSGRLIDNGQCTITRVGKRHFLTAGHCTANIQENLQIQSHKNRDKLTNTRDFKYNRYTFSEKIVVPKSTIFNAESNSFKIAEEMKEGERDWGMVIVDHQSNDPQTFADSNKWLKDNFATRKMGDPSKVKVGHTLMYAGFGTSKLTYEPSLTSLKFPTIAKCSPTIGTPCEVYYQPEYDVEVANGGDKNYAFFKVDEAGTGPTPNFFSKAGLTEVSSQGFVEYRFTDKDRGTKEDSRGIGSAGDSGSSVLNGAKEIVAVLKGIVKTNSYPFSIWTHFSRFDKAKAEELLETPILDYAPNHVGKGEYFYVLGYKLQNFDYTAGGTVNAGAYEIDSECKSLGQEIVRKFQDAGLERADDYQCYKVVDDIPPTSFPIAHDGTSGHTGSLGGNEKWGYAYCNANITVFKEIDGSLSLADFPYTSVSDNIPLYKSDPVSGEFTNEKNDPQAIIRAKADEVGNSLISRIDKGLPRDWDMIWGEDCGGGIDSGGWGFDEAMAVEAEKRANEVANGPNLRFPYEPTCTGGGQIHKLTRYKSYKVSDINCTTVTF